jgi:UDP-N-acetylmuramate dehydrogenase
VATLRVRERVPLAPLTSLELGGDAERWVCAETEAEVLEALRAARADREPVTVLGGGSNVVVPDEGVRGLVLQMGLRGVELRQQGEHVLVTAQAGEPWDPLVERTVGEDLAGLECLSGIPGLVGAAPIQNVGAYGQEVSDTVRTVRVVDTRTFEVRELSAQECGFGYRDSAFKRDPGRSVVLAVTFALRSGGAPTVRYAELERALGETAPDLQSVRRTVIGLRRRKGMVIDPADPERRTAGSFFTNPVVHDAVAEQVVARALEMGAATDAADVPRWPAGAGTTKLAAGWLIERAGIAKGWRVGPVGVSSRHALALVHHGDGHTRDLLHLALEVRARVSERFGVWLRPEPVLLGGRHALWSEREEPHEGT